MSRHTTLKDLYLSNKDSNQIALISPNSNSSNNNNSNDLNNSNNEVLTYKNLNLHVGYLSSLLVNEFKIVPGDKITTILPNNIDFVIAWLATVSIRAVAAPLNPTYQLPEYTFFIKDTQPKLIIIPQNPEKYSINISAVLSISKSLSIPIYQISSNFDSVTTFLTPFPQSSDPSNPSSTSTRLSSPPSIQNLAPIPASYLPIPEDVAMLLHTSGTTGVPKAVPITHKSILSNLANISRTYSLSSSDVVLIVMPLFHVHGLIGCLLSTLFTSGTSVIPLKFSATEFWPIFQQTNSTWYSAVPTIHQILLTTASKNYKPEYSQRLKFIRSCSSALSAAGWEQLEQLFKVPVVEAYAMTEAAHQMTSNQLPPGNRKPGSVGLPTGPALKILNLEQNQTKENAKVQEMKVGEIGEVCVQGDTVTSGYLNRSDANAEAFWEFNSQKWFRTGDFGRLDEEGFVFLTGRGKEMINRGGEKISPLEIDGVLEMHKAIAQAVSFGVKDEKYGEVVEAAVVFKEGFHQEQGKLGVSEKELKEWCRGKMAEFKVPRKIWVVKEFAKTSTGKIQRANIAKGFWQKPKL